MADYTLTAARGTFTLAAGAALLKPLWMGAAPGAFLVDAPLESPGWLGGLLVSTVLVVGQAVAFLRSGLSWRRRQSTSQPFHRSWS